MATGIGLVPEDRHREGLMLGLPVAQNLVMATIARFTRWLLLGRAHGAAARRLIAELGIRPADGGDAVRLLSGGNQQKVLIGKWLELCPRVILLDEPTVGVDVGAKAEIYAILRAERDKGAAVLVVSSDLEEVMTLADRIAVMVSGRLVAVHDAHEMSTAAARARDRSGCRMTTVARALPGREARAARPAGGAGADRRCLALAQPAFLKPENLVGILRQRRWWASWPCMTFVIMTGGIDLSVGPVLALAGLVAVFSLDAGWPLPAALPLALGAGLFVGLLNGALVALLELPPIIVTLAMLSIVRGTALMLGGADLHGVRGHKAFSFIGTGNLFGLPFSVCLFGAVALTMIFVQHAMPLGLQVAAIGENERAARLSGHRLRLAKTAVYGSVGSARPWPASYRPRRCTRPPPPTASSAPNST